MILKSIWWWWVCTYTSYLVLRFPLFLFWLIEFIHSFFAESLKDAGVSLRVIHGKGQEQFLSGSKTRSLWKHGSGKRVNSAWPWKEAWSRKVVIYGEILAFVHLILRFSIHFVKRSCRLLLFFLTTLFVLLFTKLFFLCIECFVRSCRRDNIYPLKYFR